MCVYGKIVIMWKFEHVGVKNVRMRFIGQSGVLN